MHTDGDVFALNFMEILVFSAIGLNEERKTCDHAGGWRKICFVMDPLFLFWYDYEAKCNKYQIRAKRLRSLKSANEMKEF